MSRLKLFRASAASAAYVAYAAAVVAVAAAAVLTGCKDFENRAPRAVSGAGDAEGDEVVTRAGEIPEVQDIRTQVFKRDAAPAIGPGRRTVHLFVAVNTTREERRQALVKLLTQEAASDSSLVAIRVIMYVPQRSGPQDANLVPVAWAEWLPPRGWARADSAARGREHMIYTYMNSPPPW